MKIYKRCFKFLVHILIMALLVACGDHPHSLPVMDSSGVVQRISTTEYKETLSEIVRRDLIVPDSMIVDEYDLDVLTIGLSLELGLGGSPLEARTYSQLELHLRQDR